MITGRTLRQLWWTARTAVGSRRPFRAATWENGRLELVNGLPVLVVRGNAAEMARQAAALTLPKVRPLFGVPVVMGLDVDRPSHPKRELVSELLRHSPEDHQRALAAFADAARLSDGRRRLLAALNLLFDMVHGFGCSSLIVEAARSSSHASLVGRNLDLPHRGLLAGYSLVTACRPDGKHAFVGVGFPGVLGVASGMNEQGLSLAVHGIFNTPPDEPLPNARGVPCLFLCRSILEQCATVDEAFQLLESARHTTMWNLVLCDRRRGAVAEISPAAVLQRRTEHGFAACTNHFRVLTPRSTIRCPRFAMLHQHRQTAAWDVSAVARVLHEVNQGIMTVQTMVFEPAALRLHLSIGSCPTSSRSLTALDVPPLWEA